MFTIYVLEDQRHTGIHAVKYIGQTEDVYTRFSQHLQCNESNIDKNVWIRELKSADVMLFMRTLEVVETVEEAREREQHWIHHYITKGVRLLNQDIAKSFTYEDFLAAFGSRSRSSKTKRIAPKSIMKGDAAKRIERVLRRNPTISVTDLAKQAKVSRGYASQKRSELQSKMKAAVEQ